MNQKPIRLEWYLFFLFGKISTSRKNVLSFLRKEVSNDENWRVQEILAMAFDNYCNTRRAVSEGLRVWIIRPFFKDNPKIAIKLLSNLRKDDSEYVRKSCGNALRDISKRYPEEILSEISTWESGNTKITQVKNLIMKNKKLLVIKD